MYESIKTDSLEVVDQLNGYLLARLDGKQGIYRACDDGTAYLVDDDAGHLHLPEFEGVFSCRVVDLQEEAAYLYREALAEFGF